MSILKGAVSIESPNSTGHGTTIKLEDGTELKTVRSATITIQHNAPTIANLELVGALFMGEAEPRFLILHPLTRELKEFSSIEFADGTKFPSE